MNYVIKAITLFALSGLPALAHADKAGAYVDAGIGIALQECVFCGGDVDPGFGGKIAAGYRFSDFIAVEIGYAGGGGTWNQNQGENEESSNTSFAAVLGIIPLGESFEAFGRLGYGRTRSTSIINGIEYKSRAETDVVYGFGVGYTLPGTRATCRIEYNHLSSDTSGERNADGLVGPDDVSLVSIGMVFGF